MHQNSQIVNDFSTVAALDMPGTGKFIVLAIIQHKTLDVAKLMELTGEKRRTVQTYRLLWIEMQDAVGATRAAGCAQFAQHAQPVSCDVVKLIPAHIEERAPLTELPTEVSYTQVEETSLSEVPSDVLVEVKPKPRKGRRRFAYTAEFDAFWRAYPDVSNNSKSEAFDEWMLLLPAEHQLATDGLKHLAAYCRKNPDYRCVHACRYLKQRRWESYEPKVVQFPTQPKLTALELDQIRDAKMLALCASMPTKSAVQQ